MADETILSPMQPHEAADVLAKMIGQLEIVIEHFKEQKDVSTSTRQRTLDDMHEQLKAMQHGKAAIEYCINEGTVIIAANDTKQ